jgi:hypothetical protein
LLLETEIWKQLFYFFLDPHFKSSHIAGCPLSRERFFSLLLSSDLFYVLKSQSYKK